jgi:hypothetical protein
MGGWKKVRKKSQQIVTARSSSDRGQDDERNTERRVPLNSSFAAAFRVSGVSAIPPDPIFRNSDRPRSRALKVATREGRGVGSTPSSFVRF